MLKIQILWLGSLLMATDNMYFLELPIVSAKEGQITVEAKPAAFISYETLKDDRHDLERGMVELALDAPFRQTVYLLRTLERNRGTIMAEGATDLEIMEFEIFLALRDVTGEPLEEFEYPVKIIFGGETDQGFIGFEDQKIPFTINDLVTDQNYQNFLKNLLFPFQKKVFQTHGKNELLVDLYFQWPKVLVKESNFNIFDLFPSALLWNQGPIRKVKIHMGSNFSVKEGETWKQEDNTHLRRNKEAIEMFEQILKLEENNEIEEAINLLEEYHEYVPSDKKALKLLMDLYLAEEMEDEAYGLISRFQPIFATIRDGLKNQKELAAEARQIRNHLLGKRRDFSRDRKVELKITSPLDGDLVTGRTMLEFALANNKAPILQIDCYADEQLIGSLTEPPFRVPFVSSGAQRSMKLRVSAYFENETYQETSLRVRTIDVDEEEFVNLIPLRTVVTSGSRTFITDLTKDDFRIFEKGEERKVESFRKDESPLRVAILVDTSISMFGEKLYNAQYAVRTFLSKLQPDDRAALYTFDHRVVKMAPFSNDFKRLGNLSMSLSPQLATSLYDAILVATDDLNGQNGNKVIIIVSDGSDSDSAITDIHVMSALRESSAMVYSMILPGDWLGFSNRMGNIFLEEVAKYTGSVAYTINKPEKLDEEFDKVYQELRSFYYIDYYSAISKGDREIQVKSKKGKARYRLLVN